MKFAKIVFVAAGIWGVAVITPLYFLYDFIGKQDPPPLNHPSFYFGFVGATFSWQVLFLILGSDPARYRWMMIPSIVEKLTYVIANALLYMTRRATFNQTAPAVTDLVWAILFLAAFAKVRTIPESTAARAGR